VTATRVPRAMRAVSLLGVLASLLGAPAVATAKVGKGQRAPGFSLPTLKGDRVALSAYAGQVVVLDFWAQWCEPCKKELPELDKLSKAYAGKATFLTVSIDKQKENAERLVRTLGLSSLQVLLDPAGAVAASYDLPKMPTSYLIDKKGVVRFVHEGFEGAGDVEKFKRELDELLK
jgi:peroxiredoxin